MEEGETDTSCIITNSLSYIATCTSVVSRENKSCILVCSCFTCVDTYMYMYNVCG